MLINSNYTGTSVAVFGAIERDAQTVSRAAPYDIVVTVRGPRQSLVVREKEPLGPVWINQEQQKFPDAPAFLGVFSSRPISARSPAGRCAAARRSACTRSCMRPTSPTTAAAPTSRSATPCCA